MRGRSAAALQADIRSTLVEGAVRLLPLAHYTPVSKWMAAALVTAEQLDGRRF